MRVHVFAFATMLLATGISLNAFAESEITIDGDASDWASSDAQCAYTDQDSVGSDYVDVVNICAADSFSTDGYLYLLLEFAEDSQNNRLNTVWLLNANVFLYVDTDNDGDVDVAIDFINDSADEIWGIIDLPYLEVRIDYDLIDPDGDRTFSFYVGTTWRNSPEDRVPFEDGTMLNYSVDPDTGEPRAVRMLAQQAISDENGVAITWVTASERANAGFHVFRRNESGKWTRLTDMPIPGQGDAAYGKQYSFRDPQGLPGDVYRIMDLEFTGKTHLQRPFSASARQSVVDSIIPKMTARFERPYQFEQRIRKWFATAVGSRSVQNGVGGMKYQIDSGGLYYLSAQSLSELQLELHRTALYENGVALPVVTDRDRLFFIGNPHTDRYADYSVVTAQTGKSTKMGKRRARGRCNEYRTTARHTEVIEKDVRYYISTPTDDPFYWATVYDGMTVPLNFGLPGLVSGPATIAVSLVGYASGMHTASFSLNGQALGIWQWEGTDEVTATFSAPATQLSSDNELIVELIPGAAPDMLSIDRISATYERELALQDGQLRFETVPGQCVRLSGVNDDAMVFDVTDAGRPVQLVGALRANNALSFKTPRGRSARDSVRTYLVVQKNAVEEPVPDEPVQDVGPLKKDLSAPYLMITHPLFAEAANRLAAYYAPEMKTVVVTTSALYDLYTGGRPHPDAIRQFLIDAAKRWRTPPRYVLLMGGATLDSNDILDTGDIDYLPTIFYHTNLMGYEAASDASYTIGLPDMMLGRLAVRSADEATQLVDKLISWYDTQMPAPSGASVFIADRDDAGAYGAFEQAAELQIAACGFCSDTAERLYLNHVENPKSVLFDMLMQGVDFVNFHGHAYISGWSSPQIANNTFAAKLDNEHLFFVLSWSCFDGMFTSPWDDALTWQFVSQPNGGAYGALSTSSLADPSYVEVYSQLLTEALAGGAETMGEALHDARRTMSQDLSKGALDTIYTYNLLADPAAPNPWALK
ncbi:MAG: hypothetical protein JXR45_03455 [Deltaproteobacteria bacterium]|nr:hypothetical protein [Deltaproteobacteria bacterium]